MKQKLLYSIAVAVLVLALGGVVYADAGVRYSRMISLWVRDYLLVGDDVDVGGEVTVDTINEYTSAAGVTVDSVQLKDGAVTATASSTLPGVTVTGAAVFTSTVDAQGNVSDSGGVWTLADNAIIDGQADAVQLTVQGYTTQTNPLLVLEQSDGTDLITFGGDGAVSISGGLTDIGGGSGATADGDNDLLVAGDAEVDGATDLDGTLSVAGAATFASTATIAGDVTVSPDATGGNAGAKTEISGLPRIKLLALSTMTNGSTETTSYMDDTPDGEWSEVDAGTAVTVTADSTIYRVGSKSLKIELTDAAAAGDGVTRTIASDDLGSNESIGFWIYSTAALTAGDFEIELDDDDADPDWTGNVPAVTSANVWTWVEVDISGADGGGNDANAVTGVSLLMTEQGATNLGAVDVYVDAMYKWDADDEEALSTAILQDGVLSVMAITTAQDQANTPVMLAEHTGYFVHYESGSDYLVTITDQSATSGVAMIAY